MPALPVPDDTAWHCWTPDVLAGMLHDVELPWCIVGGWALDLWHGYQTREHDDLEFTVLRDDLAAFRQALPGMAFHAVQNEGPHRLPDHVAPAADVFQVWCHDLSAHCWRADMMIEPGTPESWIYKRDPSLSRPRADMVAVTPDGIPYLQAAGVLLFKAKYCRPKDEADFQLALPRLPQQERDWLKAALMRFHPGHVWIEPL